ncbi:MAG: DUF1643 domain-containing protein [Bacteroidia bacterium]|nr:DUF1643 domain-containing protein [Bacteroidia bacterium]
MAAKVINDTQNPDTIDYLTGRNPEVCYFCRKSKSGMARIGRQVDHYSEVDTQSIRADFSPDRLFRYTLEMNNRMNLLKLDRSKTMTVILKNPSSADEKRSDSTIRKVETYVWQHFPDVRHLRILNIFAFRATDAVEVNERLKSLNEMAVTGVDNDSFFRSTLTKSDYVICAWGGPSGIDFTRYSSRLTTVRELISNHSSCPVYQVIGNQLTREPLHGLMWGYDYELKPFAI